MMIKKEPAVDRESDNTEPLPPTNGEAPSTNGELTDDDLEGVAGGANVIPPTPKSPLDIG